MTKVFLGQAYGGGGADLLAGRAAPATRPLRILLSYHYYKNEDLDVLLGLFGDHSLDVFADSGAYSAFTLGKPIDCDLYVEWVRKWEKWFTCAAGPDVIGDAASTAVQTEQMLGAGLRIPVLPTFHVGDDWKWLQHWVGKVPYLAFGGMVPYTRRLALLDAWIKRAWAMLSAETLVHGFGLTTWPLLVKYPWHSVDSSSWTSGFRFAQLLLFDVKRGRLVQINMRDRKNMLANTSLLASYGLRPTEVQASGYDRDMLCRVCIESWQRVEEWLSIKHERESRLYFVAGGDGSSSNAGVEALSRGRAEQSRGVT